MRRSAHTCPCPHSLVTRRPPGAKPEACPRPTSLMPFVLPPTIRGNGFRGSTTTVYAIRFRPRQTRKQFHSLPQKGKGRVRYQMYEELKGFKKGDIVVVKKKWVKQVNAIYAEGRLAFKRVKRAPANARPEDCHLLEREQTVLW